MDLRWTYVFSDNKKEVIVEDSANIQEINLKIDGMTCDACQKHVNHAVNELLGIVAVKTSYIDGNTIIEFDNTQTNMDEIEKAINSTGYTVTKKEENE